MRILMVSAEMAPFAKVGGLADVTTALARALAARGHDVRVVLPLYGDLDREREQIRVLKKLPPLSARVGQQVVDWRLHMRGSARAAVKVYLVEAGPLYDRPGIYTDAAGRGFADSLARASLHAQAALQLPRLLDWPVDIVHAHDAEAAPALLYRRHWYAGRGLPGAGAPVLTIHNLAHQEIHAPEAVEVLGLPRALTAFPGLLEFHGDLNLLKGGILAAAALNTVSPTYAVETVSGPRFGHGLEAMLAARGDDYLGILNGGDYETWNPRRDAALPAAYDAGDLAGKDVCRRELARELGLPDAAARPLCGFVGRLVSQKGMQLLLPILERLVGDGFRFALLGTGESALEAAMAAAAARHPDHVAFIGRFDEALAHRIYAGSDLFLMPSEFEPCGLSQMYALRYGTPPVVRRTGGLADTVIDAAAADGTGFVFAESRPEELLAALRRAEVLWSDRAAWQALMRRGMAADFGWEAAATGYEDLYQRALAAAAAGRSEPEKADRRGP